MVKKFIFQLIMQNRELIFNKAKDLYKTFSKTSSAAKSNENTQNEENNKNEQKGFGSKFNMQNLISTPMTKSEALKILDLTNTKELTSVDIINKYDKLIELNKPEKGGSFYIQNKIYYAKEFLIQELPKDDNISEQNPKI